MRGSERGESEITSGSDDALLKVLVHSCKFGSETVDRVL